ncbi:MAG: hypothetical protein GXP43_01680 [bacterium]|nr:hypothetical protein [bacterium]
MEIKENILARALFVLDGAVISASLWLAYFVRQRFLAVWYDPIQPWWVYVWLMLGAWLMFGLIGRLKSLYDWREVFNVNQSGYLWRVWESVFIFGLLIMSGSYLVKYDFSRIVVVVWWILVLLILPAVRLWLNGWLKKRFEYKMLVVGKNKLGRRFIRGLLTDFIFPIQVDSVDNLPAAFKGEYDEIVVLNPGLGREDVFDWLKQKSQELNRVSLVLDVWMFFRRFLTTPSFI